MPNLLLNLKILNPIIKDSHTVLDDVPVVFSNSPYDKTKDFTESLDDYVKQLLLKMNLSRFLVGSDYLLVTINSANAEHRLHNVSRYNYLSPTEVIKVYS